LRPISCRRFRELEPEPGNNFWATDITGVDDMRHACEPLLNLRTQETVGI